MKKQIKYLCDSGSRLLKPKQVECNESRDELYKCAKQSLEGIIVREGEKTITWGHVKRKHCAIHQPWYKRLEQYRD